MTILLKKLSRTSGSSFSAAILAFYCYLLFLLVPKNRYLAKILYAAATCPHLQRLRVLISIVNPKRWNDDFVGTKGTFQ
jgi:hypothetical protein